MSRTKTFLGLLILGIVLFLVLRHPRSPVDDAAIDAQRIILFGYTEGERMSWEIDAQEGSLAESVGSLEGVTIRFYGEGEHPLTIRGARLVRDESTSLLEGAVTVARDDGLQLETHDLVWREADDWLDSGPVHLSHHNAELSASRFSYDLSARRGWFTDGVEATIVQDGERFHVRANQGEEGDDRLVLEGDVSIHSENGNTFTCRRLETDLGGTFAQLSGDVHATLSSGDLQAQTVKLERGGVYAEGAVSLRLDLQSARKSDGT